MKRLFYISLAFVILTGCSADNAADAPAGGKQSVYLTADMGSSRTAIADDMLGTLWSAGDKISLWAQNADGQNTLSAEPFAYTGSENSASGTFVATVAAMPAGTYTYYASYPEPSGSSGNRISFEIAAQQTGAYGTGQDILLATPQTDKALTQRSSALSLGFVHVLHALRVSIPEGCNGLGDKIQRIDITFPYTVSGTALFDRTDPHAAASVTGGNTVSVVPPEGTDAGQSPLWVFIAPGDASQGTVQIDVYSEFDSQQISVAGRNFEAGHITPLKLNIPESAQTRTLVQLEIKENNLGQTPKSVIITAPENINLGNGSNVLTVETPNFATDGSQRFELPQSADDISGMEMSITYLSEDARVSGKITMPSIVAGQTNSVECRVPYLMEQDFSGLSKYTDEATTGSKDLSGVGLEGWSASRSNGTAGSHISLRPFWVFGGRYQGRLDSAPLGDAIIDGHFVNIVVSFTAGAEKVNTPLQVGSTTTTGTIDSGTGITTLSGTVNLPKDSNSSPATYTFEVSGANKATRLSWRTNITSGSWVTYSDTPIDNIRVSIKK